MAYIDKIQVGSTTYDIQPTGGPYLPLAGGQMDTDASIIFFNGASTGSTSFYPDSVEESFRIVSDDPIIIDVPKIEIYKNNLSSANNNSISLFDFSDTNSDSFGKIIGVTGSETGIAPIQGQTTIGYQFTVTEHQSSQDVDWNLLEFGFNSSYGGYVFTEYPALWRDALGLGLAATKNLNANNGFYAPTTAGTTGYTLVSNGSTAPVWAAPPLVTCSTAAATAAKSVTGPAGWRSQTGQHLYVKFSNANTATEALTLAVTAGTNGTARAAAPIYYGGAAITGATFKIKTNVIYHFVFDGTNWHIVGFSDWPEEVVTQADTPTNPHTQIWIDTDA